jgi:hypothetical protein
VQGILCGELATFECRVEPAAAVVAHAEVHAGSRCSRVLTWSLLLLLLLLLLLRFQAEPA